MAHFKIEIEGQHDGNICWSTRFYDDDRLGDADVSYINDIARELEVAIKKLHERKSKIPVLYVETWLNRPRLRVMLVLTRPLVRTNSKRK